MALRFWFLTSLTPDVARAPYAAYTPDGSLATHVVGGSVVTGSHTYTLRDWPLSLAEQPGDFRLRQPGKIADLLQAHPPISHITYHPNQFLSFFLESLPSVPLQHLDQHRAYLLPDVGVLRYQKILERHTQTPQRLTLPDQLLKRNGAFHRRSPL